MFWDPLFDRIAELSGADADQCKVSLSVPWRARRVASGACLHAGVSFRAPPTSIPAARCHAPLPSHHARFRSLRCPRARLTPAHRRARRLLPPRVNLRPHPRQPPECRPLVLHHHHHHLPLAAPRPREGPARAAVHVRRDVHHRRERTRAQHAVDCVFVSSPHHDNKLTPAL